MESEPIDPPDPDPPVNSEPTPVLAYRSAKSKPPGPTAADAMAAAIGIIIAIAMLAASGGLLMGVVAAGRAGMAFIAFALLFPFGLFLAAGLAAVRSVSVILRLTSEPSRPGLGEAREWRDTLGGAFAAIFAFAVLIVLVLLIPEFVDGTASPKKMFASAMIGLVLLFVAARFLRRAWYDFGGPTGIRRIAGRTRETPYEDSE